MYIVAPLPVLYDCSHAALVETLGGVGSLGGVADWAARIAGPLLNGPKQQLSFLKGKLAHKFNANTLIQNYHIVPFVG